MEQQDPGSSRRDLEGPAERLERGEQSETDQSTYLATEYARILSLGGFGPAPLDVEAQLDSTFSLRERRDIETVARMMTVANLVGNTVDALLARLEGQSVDDSNLADELVLTAGFSAVAPWVVLLLAVLGRKSPLAVFRAFQQFSSTFEQPPAGKAEAARRRREPGAAAHRQGQAEAQGHILALPALSRQRQSAERCRAGRGL